MTLLLIACEAEDQSSDAPIPPRPAKVMVLEDPAASEDLVYSGQVKAAKVAELSFQVPGRLDQFPVLEGIVVEKGALIARLEQQDFQIRLRESEAVFQEAQSRLARTEKLLANGHVSQARFDQHKSEYDVAKAKRDNARVELGYTTLTAPFAGQIASILVENFQRVEPGTPIVSIQDVDELEIHSDVPEAVFATVSEVDLERVSASFEFAPGREFELQFKEASTEADPATKTFRAVFSMPAPRDVQILPGMTATVRAVIRSEVNVVRFLVPSAAVVSDETGAFFAWIVDPESGAVAKQKVDVGSLVEDRIYVLDGLRAGQHIVVAGAKFLREGMVVKPVVAAKDDL